MLKRLVHQPSTVFIDVFIHLTRMHSSRMRTGRSLTVCWGVLPTGGSLPGGSPCWGVSLPGEGVSLPSWVSLPVGSPCRGVLPARGSPCPGGSPCLGGLRARGVLPARGVSLPGGSPCLGGLLARGVSLPGVGFSLPETPPPVNRITHSCKNITLATTSLRPVMTYVLAFLDKCRLK